MSLTTSDVTYSSTSNNITGNTFQVTAHDKVTELELIRFMALHMKYMILKNHYYKLLKLKEEGIITDEILNDVLLQHQLLLESPGALAINYGKYALMCKGELFIGDTFEDVVSQSRNKYGDSPYYTEFINKEHFPYLFQDIGNFIS